MPKFSFSTYGKGTLAYIDAFISGLVPCKVTDISNKLVTVKVTENHKAYDKGEVLTFGHNTIVPRDRVFYRGIYLRINTQYKWV